ncbi:dehydrogenase [Streptomyces lincolnensis]|nr:dehydrogenase [Streptomyces lincolnensis]
MTALARAGDEEFIRSLGAVDFVSGGVGAGRFDAVLDAAVLGGPALEWVRDAGCLPGCHS